MIDLVRSGSVNQVEIVAKAGQVELSQTPGQATVCHHLLVVSQDDAALSFNQLLQVDEVLLVERKSVTLASLIGNKGRFSGSGLQGLGE